MQGALANRANRRRGIAFAALLAISLVLMAFSSAPPLLELQRGLAFAFRPVQSALAEVGRVASSLVGALADIDRLRAENQGLAADNARLAAENARLAEVARENVALAELLNVRATLEFRSVAAQVVARESSEFRRVVTVDRGTDVGIVIGDVVVAAGGALAGRVIDAGPNFARVRLITDGQSTVIGHDVANAATGEVVGQLGGALLMRNIDATQRLKIGDNVMTAGIELAAGIRSPYPKGLLIGRIVDVRRDPNAVVQTAFLEPDLDLDRLEYVLVIVGYEGGLPAPDEQPTTITNPDGTLPDTEQPFLTPAPSPGGS
ncbi:MAG: rod shape-determining protein MreC [Chloroflexi bacterium]|nr:rod shape-determining protein MreC [Chloroflexota bacterium]